MKQKAQVWGERVSEGWNKTNEGIKKGQTHKWSKEYGRYVLYPVWGYENLEMSVDCNDAH